MWRDSSDVRAVARVYRRLLEVCPVGETVNMYSGRTHSSHEILSMTKAITEHSVRVEVNPAFVWTN